RVFIRNTSLRSGSGTRRLNIEGCISRCLVECDQREQPLCHQRGVRVDRKLCSEISRADRDRDESAQLCHVSARTTSCPGGINADCGGADYLCEVRSLERKR